MLRELLRAMLRLGLIINKTELNFNYERPKPFNPSRLILRNHHLLGIHHGGILFGADWKCNNCASNETKNLYRSNHCNLWFFFGYYPTTQWASPCSENKSEHLNELYH